MKSDYCNRAIPKIYSCYISCWYIAGTEVQLCWNNEQSPFVLRMDSVFCCHCHHIPYPLNHSNPIHYNPDTPFYSFGHLLKNFNKRSSIIIYYFLCATALMRMCKVGGGRGSTERNSCKRSWHLLKLRSTIKSVSHVQEAKHVHIFTYNTAGWRLKLKLYFLLLKATPLQ